jgi:putative ABC transport system substrate-binding protein
MRPVTHRLIFALVLSLLTMSFEVNAQPAAKVPRVGFLWTGSSSAPSPLIEAFRQELNGLGWVDGKNVIVEYRYAEGKAERFPELVAELVHLPVEVIVAGPAPAAVVAKKATTTIPIVITLGADPLAFGLMDSLTPQGDNITGLTEVTPELTPKRLALLKEIMPALTRVAFLWQPGSLREETFGQMMKEAKDTARTLGLQTQVVEARTADGLDLAFDEIVKGRAEALVVLMSPTFNAQTKRLADLASTHRLPTMYEFRAFAAAGGLMSYGADFSDVYRRAATYVDRLLKGAKPADLPVEGPTKFELVINRKTAHTLGLEIPQSLLRQANQVIE